MTRTIRLNLGYGLKGVARNKEGAVVSPYDDDAVHTLELVVADEVVTNVLREVEGSLAAMIDHANVFARGWGAAARRASAVLGNAF